MNSIRAMEKNTHRGFIESVLRDDARFHSLLIQMKRAGVLAATVAENRPRTRNESMKAALNVLEKSPRFSPSSPDLDRLSEICRKSCAIRTELQQPHVWKETLERIRLPVRGPVSVEQVIPHGRCNYTYRIRAGPDSHVARYHDPLGREFLQRHEPVRAVEIHKIAEQLMSTCIGECNVASSIFPHAVTRKDVPNIDEDNGDLIDIIAERILIQPDYSIDSFVLAEYPHERLRPEAKVVVQLYAVPIARLHSRSSALSLRMAQPAPDDKLANLMAEHRHLLRFPTAEDYGQWISGPNWISRRVITLAAAGIGIWPELLRMLRLSGDDFLNVCHKLWSASARQMNTSGALLHLDYNPRNCFVDRATCSRIRIFDFDYIVIADPAYDLGISIRAIASSLIMNERLRSASEVLRFVEVFLESYSKEFGRNSGPLDALLARARAFSGLAIAVTVSEDFGFASEPSTQPMPTNFGRQSLIELCAGLLNGLETAESQSSKK